MKKNNCIFEKNYLDSHDFYNCILNGGENIDLRGKVNFCF